MALPLSVDRSSPEPLYRQVERQVRDAIHARRLRPGDRVPSVRDLARELDVGRLTIATAYEQLAADGYVVGRVGFGTIVAPAPPTPTAPTARAAIPPRDADRTAVSRRPGLRYDLRPGPPAGSEMTVGPRLERLLRDAWRDLSGGTRQQRAGGDPLLRESIAEHVRVSRGGACDPDRVVVLSGGLIGLTAAARPWARAGQWIAVEDPPDPAFRAALELTAADARPVVTDRHGLKLDDLPASAALALVSPGVQPLSGVAMPLARRVALLAWAAAAGAIVVEDARRDDLVVDRAAASLHALDDGDRVVHLGGFEALIHPGVQLGFAVVPPALFGPFAAAVAALDPGATPVQQLALGRFLADGHLDRHLGRVRRALTDRLDAALGALRRDLGWLVSVDPPAGGTRFVATIEDDRLTASDAARAAQRAGVALEPLSRYRMGPGADRELLIDVARLQPTELAAAIRLVAGALAEEQRRARAETRPRGPAAMAPIPRRWPATSHAERPRAPVPAAPRAAREG